MWLTLKVEQQWRVLCVSWAAVCHWPHSCSCFVGGHQGPMLLSNDGKVTQAVRPPALVLLGVTYYQSRRACPYQSQFCGKPCKPETPKKHCKTEWSSCKFESKEAWRHLWPAESSTPVYVQYTVTLKECSFCLACVFSINPIFHRAIILKKLLGQAPFLNCLSDCLRWEYSHNQIECVIIC